VGLIFATNLVDFDAHTIDMFDAHGVGTRYLCVREPEYPSHIASNVIN